MEQELEKNLAIVVPMDRIVHTDRIQTYEGDLAPTRSRNALANWSWVSLGNNPNRSTEGNNFNGTYLMTIIQNIDQDKDVMTIIMGHQRK